jgi:hypothetical protein
MSTQSPLNAPSGESAAKTIAPPKASTTPSKTETDPRLDPRIKKVFAGMPAPVEKPNVSPACLAQLREARRCRRPATDGHQRQRVRSIAR